MWLNHLLQQFKGITELRRQYLGTECKIPSTNLLLFDHWHFYTFKRGIDTPLGFSISSDWQNFMIFFAAEGPVFCSGHDLKELTTEDDVKHHSQVFAVCAEVSSSS